jgi:hypothetical protein
VRAAEPASPEVTLHHALAATRRTGTLHLRVERGTQEQSITVAIPHQEWPAT